MKQLVDAIAFSVSLPFSVICLAKAIMNNDKIGNIFFGLSVFFTFTTLYNIYWFIIDAKK